MGNMDSQWLVDIVLQGLHIYFDMSATNCSVVLIVKNVHPVHYEFSSWKMCLIALPLVDNKMKKK